MAEDIASLLANRPAFDYRTLADPFKGYMEGRDMRSQMDVQNALKQGVPKNPDGTLNFGAMVDQIAKSGNLGAFKTAVDLNSAEAERRALGDYRKGTLGIQQGQLDLQRQQAAEKPVIKAIKDAAGNERLVQVDPKGNVRQLDTGEGQPSNPYSVGGGKMTEGQANAALYAGRMLKSEPILRQFEKEGTSLEQKARSSVPLVGNYLVSEGYQQLDQARRDFINATLRRESGAVISKEEFDNANKQYFPQPGDSAATIAQKRANRLEAVKGIASAAGPSFRPSTVIGPDGNLVPNQQRAAPAASGAAAGGAPPSPPVARPPVRVSSPQEHAALPPGTQYIAPDGSLRVKQ